jgi:hypothetical protein
MQTDKSFLLLFLEKEDLPSLPVPGHWARQRSRPGIRFT